MILAMILLMLPVVALLGAVAITMTTTDVEIKQIPRSLRRNPLPVKRINRSLLMGHKYPAGALV